MQLELFGPCNDVRGDYCEAACCYYVDKEITSDEAMRFEHRKRDGTFFLKNNPATDACVYLDTATKKCATYEDRPAICEDYSCKNDPHADHLVKIVKAEDLSLRKRVVDELRQTAANSTDPDSFMELMGL
jgi:Fe-S-cluster containining protein